MFICDICITPQPYGCRVPNLPLGTELCISCDALGRIHAARVARDAVQTPQEQPREQAEQPNKSFSSAAPICGCGTPLRTVASQRAGKCTACREDG
jgi:hypothetical protein